MSNKRPIALYNGTPEELRNDDNLIVNGGISTIDYVDFDTTAAAADALGRLTWNQAQRTLNLGMGNGVTQQIGQELPVPVKSSTNSGLIDGKVVYTVGSNGANTLVAYAQANSEELSSKTFGIMTETVAGGAAGLCTTFGEIHGLDTSYLTEGAAIWLSPSIAGGMTSVKPTAPNHLVLLGWCVRSHAVEGQIFVRIANGYELDELHDVLITNKQNSDSLYYDSASGLWKNLTPAAAKAALSLNNVENKSSATIRSELTSADVVAALTFTPENSANKNAASGYAGLDANGLIPASLLPSSVDEIIEVATYSALPPIGSSGVIYLVLDTNYQYRWSGSTYISIGGGSVASTDYVAEGAVNLYFTQARARAALSASGDLTYDSGTGVFSYTAPALDADLVAIAALAGTTGFLKKTALNTWALDTSTYLTGNQNITFTGDASGTGSTTVTLTLANSGAVAGTYPKVTVDAKGRVTSGSALAFADVTAALGYTPYDSTNPNGYTSNTGTVTSVTATAPVASTGGTAPVISMAAATALANGYMTSTYAAKLDGIAAGANNYTLPAATSTVLGGIELFSDTVQTVAANAVTATASRTYGVQVNSSGQVVVNVPWSNSGGTVTSVSGTGTVSGLTLSGTVTGSGSLTLGGTLSLTSAQVTTALGYTPYNSSNPNGYITSSALSSYLPLSGGSLTGTVSIATSGATSSTSAVRIIRSGQAPSSFGSYSGSWRSALEIWNNDSSRLLFLAPPENDYAYGILRVANGGLRIDVGGTAANVGTAAFQVETTGVVNALQGLQQAGNQVLHAGNYTSYTPSLTGSGASGTWGINITGSSGSVSGLTLTSSANGINPDNVTQNQLGYNNSVSLFGQTDGGLYSSAYSSSWIHQIYGDFRTGQIAIRGKNSGTWQAWRTVLDSSNVSSYALVQNTWQNSKYFGTDGAIYGTIFYDSNNSGYYSDPNGTSRLGTVNADTLRSYNNIYLDNNYGSSIIGVYSSYRYQGVFSMGDAYKLALDGTTTGNLYGIAWSHPNAGGIAGNLNTHGALILENGTWLASLSGSIRSRDDMRSPIFYDSNNTGYYVDPNGSSRLSSTYTDNSYSYGWFRTYNSNGLYNETHGNHWYSDGQYWNVAYGTTTGIRLRVTGHGGTIAGYYYGDTSLNSGLLNQNGSWKVRVNGSDTEIYDYCYANDLRTYIMYDRNDTSYYCDPNSTTRLNNLTVTGTVTGINGGQFYGTAATKAIAYNSNTISENITIVAGNNGLSAGPVTISTGYTVTINTGGVWVIV